MLQGIQNRSMEWYISEINMHMNDPPVEYANAIYLSYTSTKLRQESNGTKQTKKRCHLQRVRLRITRISTNATKSLFILVLWLL